MKFNQNPDIVTGPPMAYPNGIDVTSKQEIAQASFPGDSLHYKLIPPLLHYAATEKKRPVQTNPPVEHPHKQFYGQGYLHYLGNSGHDHAVPFRELDFSDLDLSGGDSAKLPVGLIINKVRHKPNQRIPVNTPGSYGFPLWTADGINYGNINYDFEGHVLTNQKGQPYVEGTIYPDKNAPYDLFDFNLDPGAMKERSWMGNALTIFGHHTPGRDYRTYFKGSYPYRKNYY